jgi:hypothetical protein
MKRVAVYAQPQVTTFAMHVRVIVETVVAVITIAACAGALFLFVYGSQLLQANRERAGVHITRTVHTNATYVSGSFLARSDCTRVDVMPAYDGSTPIIYLTEEEAGTCVLYANPRQYSFTATYDGVVTAPIRVYINGSEIASSEE